MQSGILQKTRENIKTSYTSSFGQLFVHGLTIDGVEYEWHSKSNGVKWAPGQTLWYEGTEIDKKGNNKIKKPSDKAPQGATPPTPQYQTPPPPQQYQAPAQSPPPAPTPQPGNQGTVVNKSAIWLSIFNSICTLKSGSPVELNRVIEETDKLVANRFS